MKVFYCLWFLAVGLMCSSALAQPLTQNELDRYVAMEQEPLSVQTHVKLEEFLPLHKRYVEQEHPDETVGERVAYWAKRATGTKALHYSKGKYFDLSDVNCISLVQESIALALAKDWKQHVAINTRLQFKNGKVNPACRNYIIETHWVQNNAWLLKDLTAELGHAGSFQMPIRYKERWQGFADQVYVSPEEELNEEAKPYTKQLRPLIMAELPTGWQNLPEVVTETIACTPRANLQDVVDGLEIGDLALLIRDTTERVFVQQFGIMVKDGDEWMISSTWSQKVTTAPLRGLSRAGGLYGIKFLRVKNLSAAELKKETDKVKVPAAVTANYVDSLDKQKELRWFGVSMFDWCGVTLVVKEGDK